MKIRQLQSLAVPALLVQLFSWERKLRLRRPEPDKPASQEDILIYQAMGTSFFCMAALDGVDFPKALGISASTYAQALKGRHNGQVASLQGKTLTDKEMFAAAEQQVLLRAMQACPKAVPDDVQSKVKAALQKQAGK